MTVWVNRAKAIIVPHWPRLDWLRMLHVIVVLHAGL